MSSVQEAEGRQGGHDDGHGGFDVCPHAQQHWTIGYCRGVADRGTRGLCNLDEAHEGDCDDDGAEREEDAEAEFMYWRYGEFSDQVKGENHGYETKLAEGID